jgi:hypothetical protein
MKKHKIMIIEDSHARNCAAKLQNSSGVAFELSVL